MKAVTVLEYGQRWCSTKPAGTHRMSPAGPEGARRTPRGKSVLRVA